MRRLARQSPQRTGHVITGFLLLAVLFGCLGCAEVGRGSGRALYDRAQYGADRFVQVRGHTIHYVELGSGHPILLIPGAFTTYRSWNRMIPGLATVGRVLAVDYVGVGDSDQPEDGFQYSVEEQADILSGFIEALGLSRVTVVGASYGGAVALNMAAHYPELVASVVSIEGGALVIPEILQYGSWGSVIEWPILGQITWAFMQSGLFDRLASRSIMGSSWERLTLEEQADITGIVTANIRTLTRAAWIRMYRVITGRIDFVQDLKRSQVPILYLYGSESRYRAMSEANVQELQELRNVDTLRIEGGIHDLHLQYPGAMTQLILDFLRLPQAHGPIAGLANPLGLSGKEMEERGVR